MNPYAIIAALVLWAASIAGVGYWQHQTGATSERVLWQGKQNTELAQANAQIISLNNAARADQQLHEQTQSAISSKFQKDKQNEKNRTDSIIASVHAGAFSLRDPAASSMQPGKCATSQTPASPGGRDDGAPGQLSDAASEFLLGLAGDADEVAHQLYACQHVLKSDRINAEVN